MTIRTAKLHGIIHSENSVMIDVKFNNNTVYSGPATVGEDVTNYGAYTVATWNFDESIHGVIPLTISVTGGDFTFVTILMNLVLPDRKILVFDTDAVWPGAVPESIESFGDDAANLTDEDFLQKYLFSKQVAFNYVKETGTDSTRIDVFADPNVNTVDSDGKENVEIDGVQQIRTLLDSTYLGDWHYLIEDGQQLTCNFTIAAPVAV
jgi:hypothetical protein